MACRRATSAKEGMDSAFKFLLMQKELILIHVNTFVHHIEIPIFQGDQSSGPESCGSFANMLVSLATAAGSSRVAACARVELPEVYQEFLNTSFLGPALQISVGNTSNITYHRFGPLEQQNSTGDLHIYCTMFMCANISCQLMTGPLQCSAGIWGIHWQSSPVNA